MNTYTPDELVRIEILQYLDTEGLHPVEAKWRQLARKLHQDLAEAERALQTHHHKVPQDGKCFTCGQPGRLRTWPTCFKAIDNNIFTK